MAALLERLRAQQHDAVQVALAQDEAAVDRAVKRLIQAIHGHDSPDASDGLPRRIPGSA
jgi:hypothetical protein